MTETRLDLRTLLTGIGALLLLVALFLDWYGPPGEGSGITAWQSFELVDVLLAALALATLYAILADHSARAVPRLPIEIGRIGGIAALVLIVVSMIDSPPLLVFQTPGHALEVGIWLALAGAVLMTLGSLLGRVRVSFVRADEPATRIHDRETETRPLP
jgi:hypothetical protein